MMQSQEVILKTSERLFSSDDSLASHVGNGGVKEPVRSPARELLVDDHQHFKDVSHCSADPDIVSKIVSPEEQSSNLSDVHEGDKQPCRKHLMTHLPKKRTCSVCVKAKANRKRLCRRQGEVADHRAVKFLDLITMDHAVIVTEKSPKRLKAEMASVSC